VKHLLQCKIAAGVLNEGVITHWWLAFLFRIGEVIWKKSWNMHVLDIEPAPAYFLSVKRAKSLDHMDVLPWVINHYSSGSNVLESRTLFSSNRFDVRGESGKGILKEDGI